MKTIQKNQMVVLKLNSTIFEVKIHRMRLSATLRWRKNQLLKDRSIKIIQFKEHTEKR